MASSTTTAEHQLLSGAGMLSSGPVSSSSVDDDDEIYDDEIHASSGGAINAICGVGSASANKRRKQTKPIRFSAVASEENDRASAVLDLSKATPVTTSSSATSASTANRGTGVKPQRSTPASTGAAVLDLCVKAPAPVGNSLKPHNDNNNIETNASRKRRLSGNNARNNRHQAETTTAVPVPCSMCHLSFPAKSLLQKHMKEAHGISLPPDSTTSTVNKPNRSRPRPKPGSNKAGGNVNSEPAGHNTNSSTTNNNNNNTSVTVSSTSGGGGNNNNQTNSDAANAAAAAALAQALFMPGVTGSSASTQSTITTSNGFNPALMFLPNPWASVLPPDSLAKLIQAYQLGGVNGSNQLLLGNNNNNNNSMMSNNNATVSSAGASPQTSSSPGLVNGEQNQQAGTSGRSNPTPPSSSDRSSPPMMMNNTGSDDAPTNFATKRSAKLESVDVNNVNNNWDGVLDGGLGPLPLLGFDDGSMLDQKPADSLLRSTVAARMADRVECDICHKQVCNKYFLKSHKLKIHGIIPPADGSTPNTKPAKQPGASLTASPSPSLSSTCWNMNQATGGNSDVAASMMLGGGGNVSQTDLPTVGTSASGLAEAFLNSLPGLFRSPISKAGGDSAETIVSSGKALTNGIDDLSKPSKLNTSTSNNNNNNNNSSSNNLFAGSALLRAQSPQPTNSAGLNNNMTPATPSSSSCIDLSVRRPANQSSSSNSNNNNNSANASAAAAAAAMIRPFGSPSSSGFASQQQAFPAYLAPMPGMPPGSIPPPGWRPGSSWRWKETSSISRVTCDICGKELCNKYFLRTHKQNRHGIKDETKSSTSSSSKSNKNNANNGANAGGDVGQSGEWGAFFPNKDGQNNAESDQNKFETARCRCSECGKKFLSPIVYRRHMGLCHGIPVLVGAGHEQRQRFGLTNKLKRQSRRRQQLQQKFAESVDNQSPHLTEYGVLNPEEDAVTFQIVTAITSSPNDSGMTTESDQTASADTFFDWPQQVCVYLKKRQLQTPSASSSCESGVGIENVSSTSKSGNTLQQLPTHVTLTLKLQERKPSLRPIYMKSGELLAIPSSGLEMMLMNSSGGEENNQQPGSNILQNSLLIPTSSSAAIQSMMLYNSGDEDGEAPVGEQDNNSGVGSAGEAADGSEIAVAIMPTTGSTSEQGSHYDEGGLIIGEEGEEDGAGMMIVETTNNEPVDMANQPPPQGDDEKIVTMTEDEPGPVILTNNSDEIEQQQQE